MGMGAFDVGPAVPLRLASSEELAALDALDVWPDDPGMPKGGNILLTLGIVRLACAGEPAPDVA